jgi:hypothetical protein
MGSSQPKSQILPVFHWGAIPLLSIETQFGLANIFINIGRT